MKFGPILSSMFQHPAALPIIAISILFFMVWLGWAQLISALIDFILFKMKLISSYVPIKERKRRRKKVPHAPV